MCALCVIIDPVDFEKKSGVPEKEIQPFSVSPRQREREKTEENAFCFKEISVTSYCAKRNIPENKEGLFISLLLNLGI